MTDLTTELLPCLQQYRLPGLSLGEEFIYPQYIGRSSLNIPSSLCHLFGIPEIGAGPLVPEILGPLGDGVQRVILIVMDALALRRLRRWMTDGTAPVWNELAHQGLLAPLTSITPSTTSAALTTLWTGRSAAEHGITGYEMWLKEYGIVANTILHAPITFRNDVGSLERAGFDPERFLALPTLGPHLASHGVKSYALQHRSIANSGLSKMLFKDVEVHVFHTAADLWVNLRHLLESHSNERLYTWVYWSEVDHFGHLYGPDDERTAAEFANFSHALERQFLDRLNPSLYQDTLLILTADHGQISTHKDPHYELRNHRDLLRHLHIYPTGENRLAFLYIRPGHLNAVRQYLEWTWPNQFTLVETTLAVDNGLFGPGTPHPHLLERLGDFIVVSHSDAYLWWGEIENPLFGRHGGLHPDEMLVPFLAVRL